MSTGKDLSIGLTATAKADSIAIRSDKEIYNVWKKLPDAKEWGTPIVQRLIGHEFIDLAVTPGAAYEYKIKDFNGATGYILAGYQIQQANRGKLILIVESTYAGALTSELARFVQDLQADGYSVVRRDVSKNQSPAQIKEVIKAAYLLDPDHTNTAILFGAIPVRLSGPINYDGHGAVMVASDGFYADMSGADWSSNPAVFPAKLRLIVGRIDMSNLTNFFNKSNSRSELDLLRSYLDKNHAFRTGQLNIPPIAAVVDSFSDRDFSSNAWGNFPPLVSRIEEIPPNTYFT